MVQVSGKNLILSPPLILGAEHVQQLLNALDSTLTAIA